jgi:hypothetical protein
VRKRLLIGLSLLLLLAAGFGLGMLVQWRVQLGVEEAKPAPAPEYGEFEATGHLGEASHGSLGWNYSVPFWQREGVACIVGQAGWPGRAEKGPVFVLIARMPLLPRGQLSHGQNSRSDPNPETLLNFTASLKYGRVETPPLDYRVRKEGPAEELDLAGKRRDLSQGRLFLADQTGDVPILEQRKVDLAKFSAGKASCAAVLRELADKSELARDLLAVVERR